jgi:hypothetical protein
MAARDSKSILTELQVNLVSANGATIGRAPIAEALVSSARRLLDEYVNAVNNERSADHLRLEFLLGLPGGFDLDIGDKTYGISTREDIDEAMAKTVDTRALVADATGQR